MLQLTYTRGSFIPCHLTITSSDIQALNLLAIPTAQRIRLMRRVRYTQRVSNIVLRKAGSSHDNDIGVSALHRPLPDSSRSLHSRNSSSVRQSMLISSLRRPELQSPEDIVEAMDEIAFARWQIIPPEPGVFPSDLKTRTLGGEIHLPGTLKPSCPSPLFNISVRLALSYSNPGSAHMVG